MISDLMLGSTFIPLAAVLYKMVRAMFPKRGPKRIGPKW